MSSTEDSSYQEKWAWWCMCGCAGNRWAHQSLRTWQNISQTVSHLSDKRRTCSWRSVAVILLSSLHPLTRTQDTLFAHRIRSTYKYGSDKRRHSLEVKITVTKTQKHHCFLLTPWQSIFTDNDKTTKDNSWQYQANFMSLQKGTLEVNALKTTSNQACLAAGSETRLQWWEVRHLLGKCYQICFLEL